MLTAERRQLGPFITAALMSIGCSGTRDSSDSPDNGDAGSRNLCATDAGETPRGNGSISGSAADTPFDHVASSLWIGAPDDSATSVIYLFSQPVACDELCAPGWDVRITSNPQILELKALGTSPGSYRIVKTATPAPGEAAVNYTLSVTSGAPAEISATAGTLSVAALDHATNASGNFAVEFPRGTVQGSFTAAFCPGGHEP